MVTSPQRSRTLLVAAALLAAAALWAVLGTLVVPSLQQPPGGDAVARILAAVRDSTRDGVLILLTAAAMIPALQAFSAARLTRWVRPATAESIGAMRILIAAILLGSALWEDLPSSALLPRGMLLRPQWIVGLLLDLPIGFDRFLASPAALGAFQTLTAVLLALAMVGLFTRWTVPAAALAYALLASILRSYAWSYHTGVIPLYALIVLAFTPSADALSLDRWRRARRGESVPHERAPALRYGMARMLVWMVIAVPYTLAALSKLRNGGVLWWRGEHMKQMLVATVVEPMHFDFQLTYLLLRGPGWVFDLLGISAILAELLFALVLFSTLARRVLPALMAVMHVGILLTQNILFPDLIAIQAVFYDWSAFRDRAVARWRRARQGSIRTTARPDPILSLDRLTMRQAMIARIFLVVAFGVWATRTERFPFTAMQMFSFELALAPVEYVRPLVEYEDGRREPARFERWIGAVADARYRRLIRGWDRRPERQRLLREFLDASARAANATLPPGRRVRRFILEVRSWDFRDDPRSAERGAVKSVFVHEISATQSSRSTDARLSEMVDGSPSRSTP